MIRKVGVRNAIARLTSSQPTNDIGRYIKPHGSNQMSFMNAEWNRLRKSASPEDEVKTPTVRVESAPFKTSLRREVRSAYSSSEYGRDRRSYAGRARLSR